MIWGAETPLSLPPQSFLSKLHPIFRDWGWSRRLVPCFQKTLEKIKVYCEGSGTHQKWHSSPLLQRSSGHSVGKRGCPEVECQKEEENRSRQVWVGCSRDEPSGLPWEANGSGKQGGGKGRPESFADSLRGETSFFPSASALPHSWAWGTRYFISSSWPDYKGGWGSTCVHSYCFP